MAVTRFSGRPAPPHPGGVPHLPDRVAREAYSHEVSSAGFWPGDRRYPAPGRVVGARTGVPRDGSRRRRARLAKSVGLSGG